MLGRLILAYGYTHRSAARAAGVSAKSVRRWVDGQRPSIRSAVQVAALFDPPDQADLLASWNYTEAAEHVAETHDVEVANGWRLDTLIEETRQTNRLLNRLILETERQWNSTPTAPSTPSTES